MSNLIGKFQIGLSIIIIPCYTGIDESRVPTFPRQFNTYISSPEASTMSPATSTPKIDLMDLDQFVAGRENELFDTLRTEAPVYWNEPSENGSGFWSLVRYEDVREGASDALRLSSAQGTQIVDRKVEGGNRASLHNMDDPEHMALRRITMPHFRAVSIRQWQEVTQESVDLLLDQAQEKGQLDLVEQVSTRLPMLVLARVLGVPAADAPLMVDWTNRLASSDPDHVVDADALLATREELLAYFANLTEDRRKNPQNDIVSVLANAEKEGKPLSWDELAAYYIVLVAAGNETTRQLLSGGIVNLDRNPGTWERVLNDESLLPSMTEEFFRYVSPILSMRRTASEDLEIRGQKIAAGEKVVLWFGAANRDPEVFENPHTFDIAREKNPHITFGWGAHACLGTHLARLEVRTFFSELRNRRMGFEVTGDPIRVRHNLFRGWSSVPVKTVSY